jgi:hypothetical protein
LVYPNPAAESLAGSGKNMRTANSKSPFLIGWDSGPLSVCFFSPTELGHSFKPDPSGCVHTSQRKKLCSLSI